MFPWNSPRESRPANRRRDRSGDADVLRFVRFRIRSLAHRRGPNGSRKPIGQERHARVGEALKKITERLNEANERFADARVKFGLNHPEYKKAASQVAELQQQLD